MNEIYMNIAITDFGNGRIDCRFYESINDEPLRSTELDLRKAQKLMWELVLAGGVKEVNINRYDPSIVSINTYIFLRN